MANSKPNIWHAPMPLICSSFEPGHLNSVIDAMPDSDYRTIALAEAAYFRGNADEACRLAEPFLTSEVLALRVSSCFICGFANLSLDHAQAARACLLSLASSEEHLNYEYGDQERAAYLLFTASSSVLLHLKPPVTAARKGRTPLYGSLAHSPSRRPDRNNWGTPRPSSGSA